MGEQTSVFPSELTISELTTVMVISEGKNRNEIGFAILDLATQPIVYLNQIVDNFWFTDITKQILAFQINVLIVPDLLLNKLALPKLLQLLTRKYPHIPQVQQNFRSFDARKGVEYTKKLCVEEYTDRVISIAEEKPFAIASFAALMNYIMINFETSFAPKTLRIEFLANFCKLSIDVDTVFRLELINPASCTMSGRKEAVSLFKIMNSCVTKLGSNTLRALILEPMADLGQIIEKQNCIEELIETKNLLHLIKTACRMFAVKTGVNEFLDVLRSYFTKYVDQIRDHVALLASETNLPLRMNHTIQKGFHIQLFLTKDIHNPSIPESLEVLQRTNKCITMTDAKLYDLNSKILKISGEVDIMSNGIITELYNNIRSEIYVIYMIVDIITEIDVLVALAHFSKKVGTVRPIFGSETEVVDAVHPLLDTSWKPRAIVPNSFSSNPDYNFFIITGNNMAGKTIYIKMIATLQILAQMGCYVPAKSAKFRMSDKIMSRIGFEDNIEQNASSFAIEMREIEFIMLNVTPFSLIIIDELCRSTNVEEAQVLSWSICENLLKYVGFVPGEDALKSGDVSATDEMKVLNARAPFVYVTTHFEHLLKLTEKFMNVTNLILKDNFHAMAYKLEDQKCHQQLKLAKTINFPQSVVEHAERLLNIPGLINPDPEFMAFAGKTPFTESTSHEKSTISNILSGADGNAKDLYNLYAMVAKVARNDDDEEGREERYSTLKQELECELERICNNLSDSSNFFINDDHNSYNKND
ncbi:mutS protein homolog 4-like [Culicoides brevitarsis]|uniref:mutS protein homolog 4-like n=1 Tax=Culicoides brevitarsis TaxID=469753 RepID=UPI00307BAD77